MLTVGILHGQISTYSYGGWRNKKCYSMVIGLGLPCASWCTTQVSDAQFKTIMSMVHNVALYHCSVAQRVSHKPNWNCNTFLQTKHIQCWFNPGRLVIFSEYHSRFRYRIHMWHLIISYTFTLPVLISECIYAQQNNWSDYWKKIDHTTSKHPNNKQYCFRWLYAHLSSIAFKSYSMQFLSTAKHGR